MAVSVHRPYFRLLAGDNQTLSSLVPGGPQPSICTEWYGAHGTGTGYADVVFYAQYSIGASGTQSLDLSGTMTEMDATTALPIKLKGIVCRKVSGTGTFSLSRPAANGIAVFAAASDESGTISEAGGTIAFWFGDTGALTITAATGDLLTLTEKGGAATVVVEVLIIAATA
jgi:hypothetical protein